MNNKRQHVCTLLAKQVSVWEWCSGHMMDDLFITLGNVKFSWVSILKFWTQDFQTLRETKLSWYQWIAKYKIKLSFYRLIKNKPCATTLTSCLLLSRESLVGHEINNESSMRFKYSLVTFLGQLTLRRDLMDSYDKIGSEWVQICVNVSVWLSKYDIEII